MIDVTLKFDSIDSLIQFFSKPTAPVASRPAPVEQPAQPVAAAPQPAVAPKRGRPTSKKANDAQAEVASNTASGGSDQTETQASPSAPVDGAPPSDLAAGEPPAPASAGVGARDAKPLTLQDVNEKAREVTTKFGQVDGMAKLRDILTNQIGVKLLRDVPADKYQAMYDACAKVLAS